MLLTTDFRDLRDINHERNKNPFNLGFLCSDKKTLRVHHDRATLRAL